MSARALHLQPQPLTQNAFRPFGDVIECTAGQAAAAMNDARFNRYDALAEVNHEPAARVVIGIAECRVPSQLPLRIELLERHPLGSQAFIPMARFAFIVVVAEPGPAPEATALKAFVSNGEQGINYHRGTWHLPLLGFEQGQRFLIVDTQQAHPNCDEHTLQTPVWLEQP